MKDKNSHSHELKNYSNDFEINENNITNDNFVERRTTNTILENSLIERNSISNNNHEKILHSNLSSKIWGLNEFSKIMDQLKENEMSNSYLTIDDIEIEFLQTRKYKIPSKENFEKYIVNKYDKDKREKLIEHILSIKVSNTKFNSNHSLCPLTPIKYLINKLNFKNDNDTINLLENISNIKFYRKVKGDGNSFYRIIIFQIFEIIIINKKINLLRSIILDIHQCYNNSITQNYLNDGKLDKIKPNLIFQILISIYLKCEENNIELGYKIFLISINSCKSFDEGLIWYYRYILYKYIKDNQLNHFSKTFNINIGSLLPEKYENNGNYKFDEFYQENLLKLFNNVEKIIIYVTPFIFGININLFFIDEKFKHLSFEGESFLKINQSINIFNKDGHYDLLYDKKYFENNENIFSNYINEDFKNEEDEKEDIIKRNILIKSISQKNNINDNNKNQNFHFSSQDQIIKKEKVSHKEMSKKEDFENQNKVEEFKINQNICEKCNKLDKENGFDLCKFCINEMIENECLVKYRLSLEERKKFQVQDLKFEKYNNSFDELFKFTNQTNAEKYLDFIKSKICVNCKKNNNIYKKFACGCYLCKTCYNQFNIGFLAFCPFCYLYPTLCDLFRNK